ncbi:hypothetical protein AWB78_06904 [Caballeronia calidae]|uniref:Uncharacterized protein n=1 Tax=Caballeronia calidae TaxID=1777139 RepID=A0A158EBP0_9BURK|nr:hypothetical protein AWB78_06904 [Caballeronia calidae]
MFSEWVFPTLNCLSWLLNISGYFEWPRFLR